MKMTAWKPSHIQIGLPSHVMYRKSTIAGP